MPRPTFLRGVAAATTVAALVGGALLLPATAATAAEIAGPSYEGPDGGSAVTNMAWAQTFTATSSGALTRIQLRTSAPHDHPMKPGLAFRIRAVGADGKPGAVLASSAVSSVVDRRATVPFTTPVPLTAGEKYAIEMPAFPSDFQYWNVNTQSDAYAGGAAMYSPDGTSWAVQAWDLNFRTYLEVPSPTIAGTPPDAQPGTAYRYAFDLGVAGTVTQVSAGALPPGLQLSADGVLFGTPSATGSFPFTVSASANGETVSLPATVEVRSAPSAVRELRGTGLDGRVQLSWDAPAELGNGGAMSYQVLVYRPGFGGHEFFGTVDARTVTVPLDNADDYTVIVSARNALMGWGEQASAQVSPLAAPGVPTALTVTEGDTALTASWTDPLATGGGAVTSELRTRVGDGAWSSPRPATTPAVLTALPNGVAVEVQVRARNRAQAGDWVSVSGMPRTVPDAPVLAEVTAGDGRVELSWAAPEWNGGAEITGYLIEHREVGAEEWSSSEPTPGTERTAPVSGLENGVEYEFRVIALNEAGESQASETLAEIPFRAPDAPTLAFESQGHGVIWLSLSAPAFDGGRGIEGYALEYRAAGDETWARYGDGYSATATSINIDGLTPGTDYIFRLRAVNQAGAGEVSGSVTARFAVQASAPTGLTSTLEDGAVVLNWTAPESDGGSEITRYDVIWTYAGAQTSMETSVLGTTARITGLPAGVEVHFFVHAITLVGPGDDAMTTTVPFDFTPVAVDADGAEVRTVTPGELITLADADLPVGATVTAELHSTPVALGETVIGADGELSMQVRIPKGTELGAHEIVLTIVTDDGATAAAALPVQVVAAPTGTGDADIDAAVDEVLAVTGTDGTPLGAAAMLLLALGAVALRRRRALAGRA